MRQLVGLLERVERLSVKILLTRNNSENAEIFTRVKLEFYLALIPSLHAPPGFVHVNWKVHSFGKKIKLVDFIELQYKVQNTIKNIREMFRLPVHVSYIQ